MIASAWFRSAVVDTITRFQKPVMIIPVMIVLTRSRAVVHPISTLILNQLFGDENEWILSMFYKKLYA